MHFDDREEARAALQKLARGEGRRPKSRRWPPSPPSQSRFSALPCGGTLWAPGGAAEPFHGVSIDGRARAPRAPLFFAISGRQHDGHDFDPRRRWTAAPTAWW